MKCDWCEERIPYGNYTHVEDLDKDFCDYICAVDYFKRYCLQQKENEPESEPYE